MKKLKVLNLYAGIGGNRKLWEDVEVTAVELNEEIAKVYQEFFPNDKMIVGDAHKYLEKHHGEFDFIWSSPPCTTHTRMNKNFAHTKNGVGQIKPRYPDMKLYQEIIFLHHFFKGRFCVENVIPYYGQEGLLIKGIHPKQYHRHLFWCNFRIKTTSKKNPPKQISINPGKHKAKTMIKVDSPEKLAERLGMPLIDKTIYIGKSHGPSQLYRNCVDPEIGAMILDCARGIIRKKNEKQLDLF